MQREPLIVPLLLLAAGCAGGPQDPDDYSKRPLPYSVAVFFDPAASAVPQPLGDGADPLEPPRFQIPGAEIAAMVAQAIGDEHEVVVRAVALDAATRDEAREAAKNFDFLLVIGVEAPQDYSGRSRRAGMGTLEVFAWLFGGFGSWFTPSIEYPTATALDAACVDMNASSAEPVAHRGRNETTSLSLWDRSDVLDRPGDYALTIVVPPMLVTPPDSRSEGEIVSRRVIADLSDRLAHELRGALVKRELSRELRLEFLSPANPSAIHGERPALVMELVSRGESPLAALDLYRHGEDVSSHHWVASARQLEQINAQLLASSRARVSFEIPGPLPLVAGTNLVKVRAKRADGVQVSRTAVYEYEEE